MEVPSTCHVQSTGKKKQEKKNISQFSETKKTTRISR